MTLVVTIVINLLFQSTHPVRGGTNRGFDLLIILGISIHPPREGWDPKDMGAGRLPLISIHPPREGWDMYGIKSLTSRKNFNPPTP